MTEEKLVRRGIFMMSEKMAAVIDSMIMSNPDNQIPVPPEWFLKWHTEQLEKIGNRLGTIIITSTPNNKKGFFYDMWKDSTDHKETDYQSWFEREYACEFYPSEK